MPEVLIEFHGLRQDDQQYHSTDEFMVSRVEMSLTYEGRRFDNVTATIKQTVGSNFDTDPIEVSNPENYSGPMHYSYFRDAIEAYYRFTFRAQMRALGISNVRELILRSNYIGQPGVDRVIW